MAVLRHCRVPTGVFAPGRELAYTEASDTAAKIKKLSDNGRVTGLARRRRCQTS